MQLANTDNSWQEKKNAVLAFERIWMSLVEAVIHLMLLGVVNFSQIPKSFQWAR